MSMSNEELRTLEDLYEEEVENYVDTVLTDSRELNDSDRELLWNIAKQKFESMER